MPRRRIQYRNGETTDVPDDILSAFVANARPGDIASIVNIPDDTPMPSAPQLEAGRPETTPATPEVAQIATPEVAQIATSGPDILSSNCAPSLDMPAGTLAVFKASPIGDVLEYVGRCPPRPASRTGSERLEFTLVGRRNADGTITPPTSRRGNSVYFATTPDVPFHATRRFEPATSGLIILRYPASVSSASVLASSGEIVPASPPPPVQVIQPQRICPATLQDAIRTQASSYAEFVNETDIENLMERSRPRIIHTGEGTFCEAFSFNTTALLAGKKVDEHRKGGRYFVYNMLLDEVVCGLRGGHPLAVKDKSLAVQCLLRHTPRSAEERFVKRFIVDDDIHLIRFFLTAEGAEKNARQGRDLDEGETRYAIERGEVRRVTGEEYFRLADMIKRTGSQHQSLN